MHYPAQALSEWQVAGGRQGVPEQGKWAVRLTLTLFSGPVIVVAVVSTNQGNNCAFVPKIGVSLPQKHSEPCCWERIALASRKKAAKRQKM